MSSSASAALCRVCANPFSPGTMFRLFNEHNDPLPIAEAFWRVSEIELRPNDGSSMPQKCCQRCRDRLQEVEDLRAVCLESDRKLRKMFGVGMKEEEDEDGGMGHVDAVPKVELLEVSESYSCWDDMEDRWGSDGSESDSDDVPLANRSRRNSSRIKSERNTSNDQMDASKIEVEASNATLKEPDDEEDTEHEKDSDYDPDTVEVTSKRKGKRKYTPRVKRTPKTSEDGTDKPKEKKPKEPKAFQCTWCGRIFKHKKSLKEHETSHFPDQKNYQCEICSAEFARHKYYLKHMRMHRTENQFKCNECDKVYSFDKQLQEHIRIVHRGERPHQCKICAKTFTRKSSLFQHVAYHHEKRQPYKCDVCMLRFISRYSLETHKNRHKGIKLNQCQYCPNKYESKNYLMQHIAERHPETMENLSRCQYCGLGYNTDSHYRKHVANKHPEHLEELDRWLKAKREVVPQQVQPPAVVPSPVVTNEWVADMGNNVENSCNIENSAIEAISASL